jgi:DNA invertase Pin-like site-specific DNA recombinase
MKVNIIKPNKSDDTKKVRVCAYARVSSDSFVQGESLENQIEYYSKVLSANPKYEFVRVFADKGKTGITNKRPEFQKMIDYCRKGLIDKIYTKSVSRFSRNTSLLLESIRILKELNVEVIFEKDKISTFSKDGELWLTILSSFAEEESRSISENIKWRFKKKFEKGEIIINTKRFLGYEKDENNNLIINKNEAIIVKRIFDEYLNGKGLNKIAKILNTENYKTLTGSKWKANTILGILKNEKHKGDVMLQKTYAENFKSKRKNLNNGERDRFYIKNNHDPIISRDDWDKVQKEIKKRSKLRNIEKGSKKNANRYPHSGLLYCSKCGSTLIRRRWRNKSLCERVSWKCSNNAKNGKNECSGTIIENSIVEKLETKPTIVKEEFVNGKKCYSYTSKE